MTAIPGLHSNPHRLLWPLLATVLILSWSSGFIGMRFAGDKAAMPQVLFWRMLVAGLVLLPFALLIGPRPRLRQVLQQAAFGVATMFLYIGGFAMAIAQSVPVGLVALISDLVPLAIAALSAPLLGHRLTRRQWAGTALGAFGVLIACHDSLALGTAPLWAYGMTIAAMLIFALATVAQKRLGGRALPIHQSLCIQCLTAALLFGLCIAPNAGTNAGLIPPLTGGFAFAILWLVLFSTFFAYAVYYLSLRLYSAAQVSSVIYLSPPVTMLWAWLMFGEPLSTLTFIGLAVTLCGVWLTAAPPGTRSTASS